MIFFRRPALWALALFVPPAMHAVNVRLDATTAWAENITRAAAPSDWRDAFTHEVRVSASAFRQWTAGLVTTGDIGAGFERVPRYTKLDAITAGVGAQARQKFGLGAFAPALALEGGLRSRAAKVDGDDGWVATGALRASKRVTQTWRVAAVGDWEQHYARSSIFDTRHHRVFGTIAWDITPRLQLSHGNGRLWGDFTANASRTVWPRALAGELGANLAAYYNTIPWAALNIHGPGWVTYRVTGRVNFWWLELSPAIGRDTSLPFRYESRVSVNKVGVKYRQDIWSVQFLHRF